MLRASQITRGVGVGQCDRPPDVNTSGRRAVEALGRCAGVALATLLSCSLQGCTQVSGGAVELSWSLFDYDGNKIGCVQNAGSRTLTIDKIRLWWQVDAQRNSTDWDCTKYHGVTAFDIPAGDALLWVEPQCPSGTPVVPASFMAPAPLQRTIAVGDVVELHAVEIDVDTSSACM
jgi:hypothetical protein